jgi:formiminotetrahydrofolate cyclodeaminase
MMRSTSVPSAGVREFIDAVASDAPTPGGGALDAAADVPYALGRLAAEIAAAGEQLAASGNSHLRSDACTAALLASAVAASTAILVSENLRGRPDDPRAAEARRHATDAAAAAQRAVAPYCGLQDRTRK